MDLLSRNAYLHSNERSTKSGCTRESQVWWQFTTPVIQSRFGTLWLIPFPQAEGTPQWTLLRIWQCVSSCVYLVEGEDLKYSYLPQRNATTSLALAFGCEVGWDGYYKEKDTSSKRTFQAFIKYIAHVWLFHIIDIIASEAKISKMF